MLFIYSNYKIYYKIFLILIIYSQLCSSIAITYKTLADNRGSESKNFMSTEKENKNFLPKQKRCEPITIPLCQRIGYNMTSFPNSYGHERQEEAGLEVHQFYPLVEVNCYKHLKFFLCSMYTPICQDNYELPVMPCREVCQEAQKRCAPLMQKYGFRWPTTLNCDSRLPKMSEQETTGNICAAPPDTIEIKKDTFEVSNSKILNNNDQQKVNAFIVKQNFENIEATAIPPMVGIDVVDTQCECKCLRPFFHLLFKPQDGNSLPYRTVQNVSNCAYACYSNVLYSIQDQNFLNTWISIWSGICFTLSLFTFLTFLTDMNRFPYPERPIFFLSFCQLMISIGFIIRVFYGHERTSCNNSLLKNYSGFNSIISILTFNSKIKNILTINTSSEIVCLSVFVLIYFFGMAASAWWVILSLSWVLAAVPHWSTEWIAKYSTYFHLFAWLVPGFQTILVFFSNAIDGDPISGICYVGNTDIGNLRNFVLGPLVMYFVVGVCFLLVGFLNLWSIRSNLKKTHQGLDKTNKLTQLMSKIGIFSILYTLPAIFIILVLFYEQYYRNFWEQAQLCPCAQQIENYDSIKMMLTLIKTASMLVVGWTSGVWILSAKTLQSWHRVITFFCCDNEIRRQGYIPAVNRFSGSNCSAVINTTTPHRSLHCSEEVPTHQQYSNSTLQYSNAADSLKRQFHTHHRLNNNNTSQYYVHYNHLNCNSYNSGHLC